MCEKVEKSWNTVFFPMSCGARSSGGCGAIWLDERSKFARGCGAKRVSNPKCQKHPDAQSTFGDAHFEVERCKAPQLRTAFRSWAVEKVHAVVARSTFRSQNVQSWKLSCSKSACSCGAKCVSQGKWQNITDQFRKLRWRKSARGCCAKHISKWTCLKHHMSDYFWTYECHFSCQAQEGRGRRRERGRKRERVR